MKQRLGKATLIAIAMCLIISGYVFYQTRLAPKKPPIIERNVESTVAKGISPVPQFLIRHGDELQLTDKQKTKIEDLENEYRTKLAPLKKPLDDAGVELTKKVEAKKNERTDIEKMQADNGDYQRLSAEVSSLRHEYWRKAREVLTPEQQPQVDELIKKVTATDLQ